MLSKQNLGLAGIIAFLFSFAQACTPDASNGLPAAVNATGTIDISGFNYTGSTPSNWTMSTAIYQEPNTTDVKQAIWLNSDPVQNLSSTDLPYTGCAITFLMENPKSSKNDAPSGDSCNGILSSSCLSAMVQIAKNIAAPFAGNAGYSSATSNACQNIYLALQDSPPECKGTNWGGLWESGNVFGYPVGAATNSSTCSSNNIGDGSQEYDALITKEVKGDGEYGQMVKASSPVMLVAWAKPGEQEMWSSVEMVCITADHILPGSSSAAAGPLMSGGAMLAAVSALLLLM